jgi:hypothetical protein
MPVRASLPVSVLVALEVANRRGDVARQGKFVAAPRKCGGFEVLPCTCLPGSRQRISAVFTKCNWQAATPNACSAPFWTPQSCSDPAFTLEFLARCDCAATRRKKCDFFVCRPICAQHFMKNPAGSRSGGVHHLLAQGAHIYESLLVCAAAGGWSHGQRAPHGGTPHEIQTATAPAIAATISARHSEAIRGAATGAA